MSIQVKLKHLTDELQEILYNNLTVEIKSTFVRKKNGRFDKNENLEEFLVRHVQDKTINLPLYFGSRFCKKEKIPFKTFEHDKNYKGYKMLGKCRDYQESIIDESINHIKKHKTALIAAYASAGKTFMGAFLGAKIDKVKVAIIISGTTLAKSWIRTFKDNTNAKVNYYKCTRAEYRKMDLDWEDNSPLEEADVSIIMVDRIKTIPLEIKERFGMVIVDEAHKFYTEKRAEKLLQLQPRYLIFLTATPYKKNGSDKVLKLFIGNHKVERKIDKHFKIYNVKTGIKPTVERDDDGNKNFTVLYQSLLYNEVRNKYVRHLLIVNPSFKTLVMTREKDHVEVLGEYFKECDIKYSTMYGEQKSYKDRNVLLGTVSKIGTGFDESNFATRFKGKKMDLLILLISYKDRNMYEQIIGRVFRSENPRVIFLHDDDPTFDNHSKELRLWTKGQIDGEFITEHIDVEELEKEMDEVAKKFSTRDKKRKRIVVNDPEPRLK